MSKTVALCGSHNATRHLAPWDNPDIDIWVFNEAANQRIPDEDGIIYRWVKRCSGVFQIHVPAIYRNKHNRTDPKHWEWLQEEHDFPIWMQEVDPDVPASVKYPLDEICATLIPDFYQGSKLERNKFFTSSIAFGIALAIYEKYNTILLYGIEMSSDTEYSYQRGGVAFWLGIALGRGIRIEMTGGDALFDRPLYGYEGSPEQDPAWFDARVEELTQERVDAKAALRRAEDTIEVNYRNGRLPEYIGALLDAHHLLGDVEGQLAEAERYCDKAHTMFEADGISVIDRNEYEGTAGHAKRDIENYMPQVHRTAGHVDYALKVWQGSQNPTALESLKQYINLHATAGYNAGRAMGIWKENYRLAREIDQLFHAGGLATANLKDN